MESADEGGSVSMHLYAYSSVEARRPVRELYGVFRRPRNDADRSAGELAARWGALDFGPDVEELSPPPDVAAEAWRDAQTGAVLHDEGRLILAGLGGDEDMLYAAPTQNDHVAYALLPNGGGGCGAPGPDGLELGWTQTDLGSLVVHGLVADVIEAVDVVVGGVTHEARMGENAFGVRLERTHDAALERLVLRRRDGSTNVIDLRGAEPR
jgi:hypothetical protein